MVLKNTIESYKVKIGVLSLPVCCHCPAKLAPMISAFCDLGKAQRQLLTMHEIKIMKHFRAVLDFRQLTHSRITSIFFILYLLFRFICIQSILKLYVVILKVNNF